MAISFLPFPSYYKRQENLNYKPLQFATLNSKFNWLAGVNWLLWHLFSGLLPAAVLALAISMAGFKAQSLQKRCDLDVALVYDYSGSMAAFEASGTNRRQMAAALTRRLISASGAGSLAIVGFAGKAVLIAPLTSDFSLLGQIMERPVPNLEDGTALGDAIMVALAHLSKGHAHNKKVLIISDGANNSGLISLDEALAAANELGIEIHGALIGSDHPLYQAPPAEAATLAHIAKRTGGKLWTLAESDELIASLARGLPLLPESSANNPVDFSSSLAFILLFGAAIHQYGRLRAHD